MMPEDIPPKIIVLTETTDLDITVHTAPAVVEIRPLTAQLEKFIITTIEEKEITEDEFEITLRLKRVDR